MAVVVRCCVGKLFVGGDAECADKCRLNHNVEVDAVGEQRSVDVGAVVALQRNARECALHRCRAVGVVESDVGYGLVVGYQHVVHRQVVVGGAGRKRFGGVGNVGIGEGHVGGVAYDAARRKVDCRIGLRCNLSLCHGVARCRSGGKVVCADVELCVRTVEFYGLLKVAVHVNLRFCEKRVVGFVAAHCGCECCHLCRFVEFRLCANLICGSPEDYIILLAACQLELHVF